MPLVFALGFLGLVAYVYAETPIPVPPVLQQSTFLYDRGGHLITTLHAAVNRVDIPLSQMPQSLRDAVVATEDRNFYHEGGVSLVGILRAAWVDLTGGSFSQGGSTITQQYVKNVFTGDQRTFARKIREAVIAEKLSHAYTKDEILQRYLNTVYLGHGAYGVQAAAETYWGIPARDLSVPQSATLAGMLTAPSAYDPLLHPKAAIARRDVVLGLMAQQGYLPPSGLASYRAGGLHLHPQDRATPPAPYFVSYVTQQLQQRFGSEQVFNGGLRVTTTLDMSMQRAAQRAIRSHLSTPGDPSAALVAIDPRTGGILAMVGGRNFRAQQFNLATQAERQAGSAFKPFTLAAAMEQGISLDSYWRGPAALDMRNSTCGTWNVHNDADSSVGRMSLLNATADSVNTIYAQLVADVGPASVAAMAHRLGISSPLQPYCSITLGAQPVNPLEMTDAYAALAAQGVHRAPIAVLRVRAGGRTELRAAPTGVRAVAANDANLVTYALQGVVRHGTGTAAGLPGRPVAGKTGTTDNFGDAWFCGYTPQLAACVWMGYPKGEIPMVNVAGVPQVFGGTIPAEIWHDFMLAALAGRPVVAFPAPDLSANTGRPPGSLPSPSPTPSPAGATPTPSPSASPSAESTPGATPTPGAGPSVAFPAARGRQVRGSSWSPPAPRRGP